MFRFLFLIFIPVFLWAGAYSVPENRSQAKNILKMIHLDYKVTTLNHCRYDYDKTSCMDKTEVNTSSCSVKEDHQSMVWIQVVPDTFFGRKMACMIETPCINVFTKEPFGSPMCCRRINKKYKKMEADLYNLIPVVSEMKQIQKGKIFSEVKDPITMVGETKIGKEAIEPADNVKGDIARVYLYMDEVYSLELNATQKNLYLKWNSLDGVDAQECALSKIISKIEGSANTWIEKECQ